mmetsp:Transcript_24384/g.57795  ORF Transcript_24384/g.57795 Transcript_24384/m.57795 type:complete len:323 (-) Transcript_24384:2399-3367(-)
MLRMELLELLGQGRQVPLQLRVFALVGQQCLKLLGSDAKLLLEHIFLSLKALQGLSFTFELGLEPPDLALSSAQLAPEMLLLILEVLVLRGDIKLQPLQVSLVAALQSSNLLLVLLDPLFGPALDLVELLQPLLELSHLRGICLLRTETELLSIELLILLLQRKHLLLQDCYLRGVLLLSLCGAPPQGFARHPATGADLRVLPHQSRHRLGHHGEGACRKDLRRLPLGAALEESGRLRSSGHGQDLGHLPFHGMHQPQAEVLSLRQMPLAPLVVYLALLVQLLVPLLRALQALGQLLAPAFCCLSALLKQLAMLLCSSLRRS